MLCSCKRTENEKNQKYTYTASSGIWFSFTEINERLISEKGFEAELSEAVKNCISLKIENAYHPLISEPVKNSITANKGVLLTGSNASGKSTFLQVLSGALF